MLPRANLKQPWFIALLLFFALDLGGCAIGQYGGIDRDTAVTRMFTTNTVPSNYRYYTSGRSNMPDAIIGIDPRYRLTSRFWEPVEANTAAFASKVAFIWQPEAWDRIDPAEGGWLLDSQGRKVGVWYSMFPYPVFKVGDDFQINVYPPREANGVANLG